MVARLWKEACDRVGIKPFGVRISADRRLAFLSATRDGREGSTGNMPAQHLSQPGAPYLLLGLAQRIRNGWRELDERRRAPQIYVGT